MKIIVASLALASLCGLAQAQNQTGHQASLDFRIIVPRVMQVTPSLHPNITAPGENEESLTVTHNLPRLCLTATTTNNDPAWEVKVAGHDWQAIRYANSYQLCTNARGHVPLEIIHTFGYLSQPWPIRLTASPI